MLGDYWYFDVFMYFIFISLFQSVDIIICFCLMFFLYVKVNEIFKMRFGRKFLVFVV